MCKINILGVTLSKNAPGILGDCNVTRSHENLVRKRTLFNLAKLACLGQFGSIWLNG